MPSASHNWTHSPGFRIIILQDHSFPAHGRLTWSSRLLTSIEPFRTALACIRSTSIVVDFNTFDAHDHIRRAGFAAPPSVAVCPKQKLYISWRAGNVVVINMYHLVIQVVFSTRMWMTVKAMLAKGCKYSLSGIKRHRTGSVGNWCAVCVSRGVRRVIYGVVDDGCAMCDYFNVNFRAVILQGTS